MENMRDPGYECNFKVLRNVKIAMRDGIHLSATIYLPVGEGPFPAILSRSPYGLAGNPCVAAEIYASKGYAYVQQDVRGRYDSEGDFYPFRYEVEDGIDTLNWVGGRDWCDGNIGMTGPSYMGAVQWCIAHSGNPYLKTIIPSCMCGNYWKNAYWFHGAFSLIMNIRWLCMNICSRTNQITMTKYYEFENLLKTLPLCTIDEKTGFKNEVWHDFLENSENNEFWKAFSNDGKYEKMRLPVYIMDGWYDYYSGEAFDMFNKLIKYSENAEIARGRRILIGPWTHLISRDTRLGELDFGKDSMLDIVEEELKWFDYWLKGIDTGILDEPPVQIFVMGINQWIKENEWPLKQTQYTKLYLHSKGHANTVSGDGYLSEKMPGDEHHDQYIYNPEDPVPAIGGNHSQCYPEVAKYIQAGPFDQKEVEQRADVLVFTGEQLEDDLEVTGPVSILLYAETTALDTDFTAKLVDVYPDGRAINITEGIIRGRYRQGIFEKPRLLEKNRVYAFSIELHPTSNVFKKGHCIRVDITSSNFPLWDRNLNTGQKQGMSTDYVTARQTIYHNKEYASYILLPIIPYR